MPDYVWVAIVALVYSIKEYFDRKRDDRLNVKVDRNAVRLDENTAETRVIKDDVAMVKVHTNKMMDDRARLERGAGVVEGIQQQKDIQEEVQKGVEKVVEKVEKGVEKVVEKEVKQGVEQVVQVVEQGVEHVADKVIEKVEGKKTKEG